MRIHLLSTLILFFSYLSSFSQSILFVGNSLTYTNNLPGILEEIAIEFGESIKTTTLAFPNYAIEDHWNDGIFQKKLIENKFEYVIIQQGPSSQPDGKEMLVSYGAKMKLECNKNGAELAYFMVWPSKRYFYTFDGVIKNYSYAAESNKAILFPVGRLWKKYEASTNTVILYGSDDFHPSKAGSFLAALAIFHGLYPEKDLLNLDYNIFSKWVENKDAFDLLIELVIE